MMTNRFVRRWPTSLQHLPRPSLLLAALPALLAATPVTAQTGPLLDLRPAGPRALQLGAFELAAPADVRIEAVGAPARVFRELSRGWLVRLFEGLDLDDDRIEGAWAANAWILDARTRKPVWELSQSSGRRLRNNLREHTGALRLPAGVYEVYYATVAPVVSRRNGREQWNVAADVVEQLGIRVRAPGRLLSGPALQQVRASTAAEVVLALHGGRTEANERAGFELTEPAAVEVVMAGEADRHQAFDYGWIINADTRERVWSFEYEDSRPAGGSSKNRIARAALALPAGRYAAFFVSDDSHGPADWNAAPPYDPQAWGLYLRVPDAEARAAVRRFEYQLAPADLVAASITRVGNDQTKRAGFALARPVDVRVLVLGEGTSDDLDDYGWIVDADTRELVWRMAYDRTEHAGGGGKNRVFDGIVPLPAGRYEVHYLTDGSHAWDSWNTDRPLDAEYWGITVLAARAADRAAFEAYDPAHDPSVVAQLVGMGNDQRARRSFRLETAGDLRVYALGEGGTDAMYDYAWIEDAATRQVVWEMTWSMTSHAGGADKNRVFDGTVRLPAGEYYLNYRSDDSHSFGHWNASPPADPSMWGVTLRRAQR